MVAFPLSELLFLLQPAKVSKSDTHSKNDMILTLRFIKISPVHFLYIYNITQNLTLNKCIFTVIFNFYEQIINSNSLLYQWLRVYYLHFTNKRGETFQYFYVKGFTTYTIYAIILIADPQNMTIYSV